MCSPKVTLQHSIMRVTIFIVLCKLKVLLPIFSENIMDELLPPLELDRLTHILDNSPGILVFGQDSRCKASLVNRLLSRGILPICNGSWRWVRIKHGQTSQIALTLGMEYELVERLHANERSWHSIPLEDLARKQSDDANCPTILEVTIDESQLKHGVQIFVVPSNEPLHALTKGLLRVLPIFIYALGDAPLSLKNLEELREIRENYPDNPVLFVSSLLDVEINGADAELTGLLWLHFGNKTSCFCIQLFISLRKCSCRF